MKTASTLFTVISFFSTGASIQAQTLNWGNVVGGPVLTSSGTPVDNTFVFELGAFANNFVPEFSNASEWVDNWRIFDTVEYHSLFGFSTGTAYVQNNVTSTEPGANPMSFAGLDAYIFVRKGDLPEPGSEWLLTRSSAWAFPATGGTCCDTSVLEWSVSDLNSSTIPKIGSHNGVDGPGVFTPQGPGSGLQTHTFIPEPSAALLAGLAGIFALMRRRRNS